MAVEIVQQAEVFTSVAYMETFLHSTAYDVLVDEVDSGRLGNVSRLVFRVRGGTPANLDTVWRGDRSRGGEVLHDWGVHSVGLALHFLGSLLGPSAAPEVVVVDAQWKDIGDRKILTSCDMVLEGAPIPTSIRASWDGGVANPESPDVLVECERGQLSLVVQKTDGTSDWVCTEADGESVRRLASRRYPKELFIRGVDGFLRDVGRGRVVSDKYNVSLGLEAIRLMDSAYSQALRK